MTVLQDLRVQCEECGQVLPIKAYDKHISNGYKRKSTATISIQDMLEIPNDTPLTPLEQKIQCTLVKCSLNTSSDESVLRVKTGGQVMLTIKLKKINTATLLLKVNNIIIHDCTFSHLHWSK